MQFIIRGLFCFSSLFYLVFAAAALYAATLSGPVHVDWVADGDTLYAKGDIAYRLQGIDAPETGHKDTEEQYFSGQAAEFMRSLVREKKIYVDRAHLFKDRYGRYISRLYLPDGRCLNRQMVLHGYAFYYPHGREMTSFKRSLLEAQREAILKERGFWPKIFSLPRSGEKWMGNKNSKRFHSPDCKFGRQISRENRRVFDSLKKAFVAGFAPCRECSPWPEAE